ncbi:MAG: type II toxin-antitoxin system PemK/MazF family toxin [Crocosphaera sp.]|nr:type II toxin-antitoxin system PemK/MazF family toxin [Crocosphaera sp.]
MNNYESGEIILIQFVFSDIQQTKRRPGLVLLDTADQDIIVTKITSRLYYTKFDFIIQEWQKAGLLRPSTVRLHKINTLSKSLINRRLGKLEPSDWQKVKEKLGELWGFD